jgi:hypothetical protein
VATKKTLSSKFIIATERLGLRWDRLGPLGLLLLIIIRGVMRKHNLYDTRAQEAAESLAMHDEQARLKPNWRNLYSRSSDGSFNDLSSDTMGKVYTRFGRNIPPADGAGVAEPGEEVPSPIDISNTLLRRDKVIPAATINLLAAAWIQFMVHDWFGHRRAKDQYYDVSGCNKRVRRTLEDNERPAVACPPYLNDATHWWDASQLYGSDQDRQDKLRAGPDGTVVPNGKLYLPPYAADSGEIPDLLPVYHGSDGDDAAKQTDDTGVRANWWVGLGLMHTLFAREHNAICDHLQGIYGLSGDDTFQLARLINSALIAKIHTIEWTPALLDNKTTIRGMQGSWWGVFAGEWRHRRRGRRWSAWRLPVLKTVRELLGGIPGSATEHYAAPYAITEEFVSIYRMHSLIPDTIDLYSIASGQPKKIDATDTQIENFMFQHTGKILSRRNMTLSDMFYSFGRNHPGALTLNNYGEALRNLEQLLVFRDAAPTGDKASQLGDLGAIDILRDRERGVPRYNDFREFMHRPRLESIDEISDDPAIVKEIKELYQGDVNKVDLLIGLLAEKPPKGFAFGESTFRLFVLMASRRLKSDRFFTDDYRPEIYTQAGLDWIDNNTMQSVLLRHLPDLAPHLSGVDNAFRPWPQEPANVHRPPKRSRIPWIRDDLTIDDPACMRLFNDCPGIDRKPPRGGPLFNRFVQHHINSWFRGSGTAGGPIPPVFAGKDEGDRAEQQQQLDVRLSALGRASAVADTYIEKLGAYLTQSDDRNWKLMGTTMQEMLGRLFFDDYTANELSYLDACIVGSDKLTKRLFYLNARAAKRRLWAAAKNDPQCIHATVFAVHSMTTTLKAMRKVFAKTAGTVEDAEQIVTRCLQPPRRLLRYNAVEQRLPYLNKPVPRGALIFFKPRGMHAGSTDSALAFARGEWNQCPAHVFAPDVLKRIWIEAKRQQERDDGSVS